MVTLEKLVETGQKISDAVHTAYVAVLGNRVTAAAYVSTFNYFCASFSDYLNSPTYFLLSTFALVGITPLFGATSCAENTIKLYKRTRQHIRDFGYLDERFVKKVISKSENGSVYGYCEQQGVYLAAIHQGQAEVFRKVQKQYSNIKIPFF